MSVQFYVYEHWRLDRDECFYVGKGKGRRAYNMGWRNPHHKAIQAKVIREGFAIDVRIVATGLSEEDAFILECERIAFWRAVGVDLANITNGGDGVSGLKHSDDSKKKMSDIKLGKKPPHNGTLGMKFSDETKAKMRAHKIGKNPNNFGTKRSQASKNAMSEQNRKRWENDSFRQKMKESMSKIDVKSAREKQSQSLKAFWSIPENKERMMAAKKRLKVEE